ncbi:MAG: hypothetical protein NVSMB3_02870 [Acidobacteriaceae bacterium]
MPVPTHLEILDLRHFSAKQLRPLLETEAHVWQERLRWNYRGSTELLLQYLDTHVLPGFVALENGKIYGFTFCVYEGIKAVVGDAFAVDAPHHSATEVTRKLLQHLLELLRGSPSVDRIESQLLLYDSGSFAQIFKGEGFTTFPRLFTERDLSSAGAWDTPVDTASGLSLRRWSSSDYQAAAELIHACYAGHVDARINDQYRSLHGSLRFLHNIVRFPGCGVFQGEQSWVLAEEPGGKLVGIILCSRVDDGVAHVTQLCVAPQRRGERLGALLLQRCMEHLKRSGYDAISLTVTEENLRAVRLYQEHGFVMKHRFDAMVLDKNEGVEA